MILHQPTTHSPAPVSRPALRLFRPSRLLLLAGLGGAAPLCAAESSATPFVLTPENLPVAGQHLLANWLHSAGASQGLIAAASAVAAAATVAAIFGVLFALLSLVERKVIARMQNRPGPNRAGPGGILQPLADAIKMLTKEDIVPLAANKVVHFLAPVLVVIPALLALGLIPYGREWTPLPLEVGLLFFFAIGAVTEMGVFMAGWAGGSKFPMLGAMRAIAQIISYELPLILSATAVVMLAGTLSLPAIVEAQGGYLLGVLPAWNLFTPWGLMAGIIFFIAGLAETNRTPFDLPEGESEIVAGHMTEYSGFKYALFFMGEYLGLLALGGLGITLFLGGWHAPFPGLAFVPSWAWFFLKLAAVIFVFLWIRATFPRVRIDQLMRFAWMFLIPVALLTLPSAAVWHYTGGGIVGWLACSPFFLGPYAALTFVFNRGLAPGNRSYRFAA